MLTMTAARRTAAVLTATLVAVLLVTLGAPAQASGHRTTAGAGHAGATVKQARVPQALVAPAHHQAEPLHLDLASTPPVSAPDMRPAVPSARPELAVVRTGLDRVAPVGRGPPAR